jgi:hypothetical protein
LLQQHGARRLHENSRTLKRQDLEVRVLRVMRERFFKQGAFDAFREGFAEELNRLRREHRVHREAAPREIDRINWRSKAILYSGPRFPQLFAGGTRTVKFARSRA